MNMQRGVDIINVGNYDTFSTALIPVHWFLYKAHLGMGTVPKTVYVRSKGTVPYSYVRVCPVCGDSWSRVVVACEGTKHIPESRKCPRHGDGFLGTYEDEYTMPREAMIHDLKQWSPEKAYMISLLTGGN